MRRQRAFEVPGLWAGVVRTQPGATSGWHHHGEHETSLYVVEGRMRLEFGPGGQDTVEGGPGAFLHVPAGTVHRESNPSPTQEALAVIPPAGRGAPTPNVDGPPGGTPPGGAGAASPPRPDRPHPPRPHPPPPPP